MFSPAGDGRLNGYSLPGIHPSGWPFIAVFAAVAVVLALLSPALGVLGAVATVCCACFFRDPKRAPPVDPRVVVSPADGIVLNIVEAAPPPELDMGTAPRPRVSIFLSIFDVHVNRVPADGTITRLSYRPGKFFNAAFDKASELNERMAIRMTTATGHDLAFVQIAGLVARRIECKLEENQKVRAGERFGIIRFGSRMDVYVPQGHRVAARAGQRAVGGETVISEAVVSAAGSR
jgi:phosphatidylserine decarboxylase